MTELFRVKDIIFNKEEFLDNIDEYDDIIPILRELAPELDYEIIEIADENGCCDATKKNILVEIIGYLNEEDEFITKEERESLNDEDGEYSLFVIDVYKCTACGKWSISILE